MIFQSQCFERFAVSLSVAKCVLIELCNVCQSNTQSDVKFYVIQSCINGAKKEREREREMGKANLMAKVMPSAGLRLQCNSRVKCASDWFKEQNVVRMLPREGISRCLCGHVLFALVGTCWNGKHQKYPKRLKHLDYFAFRKHKARPALKILRFTRWMDR